MPIDKQLFDTLVNKGYLTLQPSSIDKFKYMPSPKKKMPGRLSEKYKEMVEALDRAKKTSGFGYYAKETAKSLPMAARAIRNKIGLDSVGNAIIRKVDFLIKNIK
jgi:hypothetical protein